jgi:hypothetical protein
MNSLEKIIFIYILLIYKMDMYYIIKKIIDISNNDVEVRTIL